MISNQWPLQPKCLYPFVDPLFFPFFLFLNYVFIFLHRVYIAACELSLVALSRAALHCSAWAFPGSGFSRCGAQAVGVQAQWLRTQAQRLLISTCGLVALRHVGSSWTRDQSHAPCIDRQILNHWTTREILHFPF